MLKMLNWLGLHIAVNPNNPVCKRPSEELANDDGPIRGSQTSEISPRPQNTPDRGTMLTDHDPHHLPKVSPRDTSTNISPGWIDPELATDESPVSLPEYHYFSRSLAKTTGIMGAIVLRYLCHRVTKSRNMREGKQWIFDSTKAISARVYPYISPRTLNNCVIKLAKKGLIARTDVFNRRSYDRTSWYSVNKEISRLVNEDLAKIRVADAEALGINGAAVLEYLRQNAAITALQMGSFVKISQAAISQWFFGRLSVSTVQRMLKDLERRGCIESRKNREERCSEIRFTSKDQLERDWKASEE